MRRERQPRERIQREWDQSESERFRGWDRRRGRDAEKETLQTWERDDADEEEGEGEEKMESSAMGKNHKNQERIQASHCDFFISVEIYELKSGWLLEFG